MNSQSLRYKLVVFISTLIVLMEFINVYSILSNSHMKRQYSSMIGTLMTLNSINQDMNKSVFYFDEYFNTKDQSDLDNYRKYSSGARDKVSNLEGNLDYDDYLILMDLKNKIQSYYDSGEETVFILMSSQEGEKFYADFVETKQIAQYCSDNVQTLCNSYLQYNNNIYIQINEQSKRTWIITIIFFIIITICCIIYSIIFSKKITDSLVELADTSQRVSKGNFTVRRIPPSYIYEIDALAEGFNSMITDINVLIRTIKQKASLEKKLKDQEMKNLLVENMLRESQLKMLQSQVNPHFLFNALNSIAQTSMLEDAPETEKLINSVSELLRYSLSMIDKQSTIKREIEITKQYIYIQKTRFKDRIRFNLNVDESLYNVQIPGMILQPLVENAFMHGIEGKEEGGTIDISVLRDEGLCTVIVKDDGVGITEDKIREIMNDEDAVKHTGRSAGIGLKNVIRRLRLFYNFDDVFQIKSTVGSGTRIYINIPVNGGN